MLADFTGGSSAVATIGHGSNSFSIRALGVVIRHTESRRTITARVLAALIVGGGQPYGIGDRL